MDGNSFLGLPVSRGLDLHHFKLDRLQDTSFLPLSALSGCNRLILSLLTGNDIQADLDAGANPDGITDKTPFMSPLVWIGLIAPPDWEEEKAMIRKLLLSGVDCNYIGLCGFNLFHFYLVQALIRPDGFHKLRWWADMPMVDTNTPSLCLSERPRVCFLHPTQLITRSTAHHASRQHARDIIIYLLSRGTSARHFNADLVPSTISNPHLSERLAAQRHDATGTNSSNHHLIPTPQMNDLADVPADQHLTFTSSNGLVFRFHASYMDVIIRTQRFPFTMEPVPRETIAGWLRRFEEKWVPREEFVRGTPFLSQDSTQHNDDHLFFHKLDQWLYPIYPYSRIVSLASHPLTERMFEYICLRMRAGVFHLRPFHKDRKTTWKEFFMWACYDCVDEFLFASQMEEVISQLEIFYSKGGRDFLRDYPDVESFFFLNQDDLNPYKIYAEEFDYTMPQVHAIFKRMFLFNR